MRWIAFPLLLVFAAALPAQEELPKDPEQPMEIEPPLLIQETPNQNVVSTRPDGTEQKPGPDVDQLTAVLEKARGWGVAERFGIAEVAERTGVEPEELRRWQRLGLLSSDEHLGACRFT